MFGVRSTVRTKFAIGWMPEIWGKFSKMSIKIIKYMKIIDKIWEKVQILHENFILCAREI